MNNTFNLQSASEYLNIGTSTLQEMVALGKIPGAKIGKSWVFHADMLSEWLRDETLRQTSQRKQVHDPIQPVLNIPVKSGRKRSNIPTLP